MVTSTHCRHCGVEATGSGRFCASCGSALSPSGESIVDELGTRLREATHGEYDVVRLLGRGGMAGVYLAWDLDLARHVALKVMFPELAHQSGMTQRFLREARLAASLDDHPNVVRVYRARDVDGLRFIAMKYIDGCSLDQLLDSVTPLPLGIACHVLDQVVRALQYAHARGVVHRDVKPSNIMLDRHGTAIVTDFGIARALEGERLTRTGLVMGTPEYMSPEQWRDEPITAASDQYAVGIVAYRMLTGHAPFQGTAYEMQEQHVHQEPPALRTRRPDCPPVLESTVRRMLAKTPGARWPNLDVVHEMLAVVPRAPAGQLAAELSALIERAAPMNEAADAPPTPGARGPADRSLSRVPTPGSGPRVASPLLGPPASTLPPIAPPPITTPPVAIPVGAVTPGTVIPPEPPPSPPVVMTVETSAPAVADIPVADPVVAPVAEPEAEVPEPAVARDRPWRTWALVGGGVVVGAIALALVFANRRGPGVAPVERAAVATGAVPTVADTAARAAVDTVDTVDTANAVTPADTAALPPPVASVAVVPVGPPARLRINGAPAAGTLALGDSVLMYAQVFDSSGRRVTTATVEWATSDSTRVRWHRPYAVARATGGPVTLRARSGALTQAVTFVVDAPRIANSGRVDTGSRVAGGAGALNATPTSETVTDAVESFAAVLRERRRDELATLMAGAPDSASVRDFLRWIEKTDAIRVESVVRNDRLIAAGRGRVVTEVGYHLSWRSGVLFVQKRTRGKTPLRVDLTLAHDGAVWRVERAQLMEPFRPR